VVRTDLPGTPIQVNLVLRGATVTTAYANDQGKFGFYSLQGNPYHIVINDDRFYPVDQQVRLDPSVTANQMVQITLTPRAASAPTDTLSKQKGSNPYIVDLEQYRRNFPKKAVKEFDKGLKADQNNKRDEAIRHYEEALKIAPDFYPAHNNLGSDYLAKSDFPSAQSQFESAIKLNQSDPEAYLNLANVLLQTKNYDAALKNVQEGLRKRPDSALGHFLLGSIYERMSRFTEAERALREAMNTDPTMSRVRLELVNLYLAQKRKPEAVAELKDFVKVFPDDPMTPKARQVLEKLQK
jgi:tetratricopeptide (TPR) repeat protein